MNKLRWCLLALVLASSYPRSVSAQSDALRVAGVEDYVREVLVRNPSYAAAQSRLAAAVERIAPAGALPDPALTVGIMALPVPSLDFTAERMTRIPIGARQTFPFPGKQAAATAVARADSAIAETRLGAEEAVLVAAAVRAYYALAFAETTVSVWRARVSLADQAIAVAQTRYETGAAPQTDLIRARLRRAELAEVGREFDANVLRVRAAVDALRGGSGDPIPSFPLLGADGQPAVDVRRDVAPADVVERQLRDSSPNLRVAAAAVERATRNARVFDIAGRPDFTVSLENGIRFGGREPFTTAMVGLSVPLWSGRKQAPAARAAHHEMVATQRDYDDLLAQLTGELRDRLAQLDGLRDRTVQTVDDILPLAGAASTSALQRYQVGGVTFTTVLETQDDLFRAQLRLARIIADFASARAGLAALVGEEWYR